MFIIVLDYVLLEAIEGHEECLGLTMKPRQGRRVKAENVTKLNFADDIALYRDQFPFRTSSIWVLFWISDSEHHFKVRKASTWIACKKIRKVWTSKLPKAAKIRLFRATVESVLLYGSETWTATKKLEKSVNRSYTRMLRTSLVTTNEQPGAIREPTKS